MKFKKYNVSKPRKELLKDGTEKTFWDNVGTLTIFIKDDGSESGLLDLVTFAQSIHLNVFPFKPKEEVKQTVKSEDLGEEINVEEIPF